MKGTICLKHIFNDSDNDVYENSSSEDEIKYMNYKRVRTKIHLPENNRSL